MGYYRGVRTGPCKRREKLAALASEMRRKYLTSGSGCKSRLKAILKRTQEAR